MGKIFKNWKKMGKISNKHCNKYRKIRTWGKILMIKKIETKLKIKRLKKKQSNKVKN